jgi:hypothetical protein
MLRLERRGVSPLHSHRLLKLCENGGWQSREGACWGRGLKFLDDGVPVQSALLSRCGGLNRGTESEARHNREEKGFKD